ncbi:MAG: hypothetical protein Q9216_000204 [Gyalolechia sp. 2 TL-2023]
MPEIVNNDRNENKQMPPSPAPAHPPGTQVNAHLRTSSNPHPLPARRSIPRSKAHRSSYHLVSINHDASQESYRCRLAEEGRCPRQSPILQRFVRCCLNNLNLVAWCRRWVQVDRERMLTVGARYDQGGYPRCKLIPPRALPSQFDGSSHHATTNPRHHNSHSLK